MSEPSLEYKGSCRIAQDDTGDTFVGLSNSGMFSGLTHNGDGDTTIDIDDEFRITPRDQFHPTMEGDGKAGYGIVERLSETQIRVRCFNSDGAADNVTFGLVCTTFQIG